MDVPILPVAATNEEAFFRSDAVLRIKRMIELSVSWWCFVLLLYARLLTPTSWQWIHLDYFWVFIFLPLMILDLRNCKHVTYLRSNSDRLWPNDALRYSIVICSELFFKVLFCLYLSIPYIREKLQLQVVTLPYCAGYLLHFFMEHWAHSEDVERPEGCSTISSRLSEFVRFFMFCLVVSVTWKVEKMSTINTNYDWKAAFWPCWGLEALVILLLIQLTPITLVSIVVDRPRVAMLTWVILSAGGVGICCFMATYHMTKFLDDGSCVHNDCEDASSSACQMCRRHLNWSMLPWMIFLPVFAAITQFFKTTVAESLHDMWYQPLEGGRLHARQWFTGFFDGAANWERHGQDEIPEEIAPPPVAMFKVSSTFYTRTCDPVALDLDVSLDDTSLVSARHTWARLLGSWPGSLGGDSMRSTTMNASMTSRRSACRNPHEDPYASHLSAQGSTFPEIVEFENVCGICYDAPPEAALMECGHAGYCMDCARRIQATSRRCPSCRARISNIVRLRPDINVPKEFFIARPSTERDRGGASLPASRSLQSGGVASFDTERARAREARRTEATELALAAVEEATTTADFLKLPSAKPPWPHAAWSYAVMVDAEQRPPHRRAWWLSIFRPRHRARQRADASSSL